MTIATLIAEYADECACVLDWQLCPACKHINALRNPEITDNDTTEVIACKLAAQAGEDYDSVDSLQQLHWIGEALEYIMKETEHD